jgi:hypothetical protein
MAQPDPAQRERQKTSDFPFFWQRREVCPVYGALHVVWGDYGVYRRDNADEDDRGGTTAWEVWHWPSNTAESDWFTLSDAIREARRLYAEMRWPNVA